MRVNSTQLNALALNNKIHEHDALTSRVGLGWVGSLLNAIYLTIYKVTELIQSPSNEWSLSSFICFCHPRSRSLFNFKLQTLGRGILIKVFWQKEKERAGERLTSWVYLLIKDGCQVSPNPPRLLILTQLASPRPLLRSIFELRGIEEVFQDRFGLLLRGQRSWRWSWRLSSYFIHSQQIMPKNQKWNERLIAIAVSQPSACSLDLRWDEMNFYFILFLIFFY